MEDHRGHALYTENEGSFRRMPVLPLPPPSNDFPHPLVQSHPEEPKFDPALHLAISAPKYVRLFPDLEETNHLTAPKVADSRGSRFAFSGPFHLLSDQGLEVVRSIVAREQHRAVSSARGSKRALRGCYYASPFIRDLQNCPELLAMFERIVGQPLLPHFCFSNSPQVNLSSPGSTAPVDHWHNDSIAFAGVVVLSDMQGMEGGKLELYRGLKEDGRKILRAKGIDGLHEGGKVETVSYEKPGNMILTQGAEVLHHVTPVTSNHVRQTLIFGLTPANAFQPPRTIYSSMVRVDWASGVAPYEYYREKAWQLSQALAHLAEKTTFTKDTKLLAQKLRSVREELTRASDLLDGTQTDVISFFDEVKGEEQQDYVKQ